MIRTARQLKALVRNRSGSNSNKAQTIFRIYAMERFLERLSVSAYKDKFIIKGGFLVSSLVGIDKRATMDIDTTVRSLNLSIGDARRIAQDIIRIPLDDGMRFELQDISEIMEDSEYTGVRLHLIAWLETMRTPVKIDISTGDVITPRDIRYSYKLMFEDRSIELYTYNLSTIFAEKMETVLARGKANTRLRDYYDIYILLQQYSEGINLAELKAAFEATCHKRGSSLVVSDGKRILSEIADDENLQVLWNNYQKKFEYAQDICWNDIIGSLERLFKLMTMPSV